MKYKLTSVIIKSGRVISTGHNKQIAYSGNYNRGSKSLWDVNRCAEKDAILKALKLTDGLKHLAGSTIYVSRHTAAGKTALAKPCKYCTTLIQSVGIKRVVYTTETQTKSLNL